MATKTFASHLTFKGNLGRSRYSWLRLTPAYSVHLVSDILKDTMHHEQNMCVLDPFCGTGTTALVCAEQNILCATTDINPFLIWLTQVKTNRYSANEIQNFLVMARQIAHHLARATGELSPWLPELSHIEKWWDAETLHILSVAMDAIKTMETTKAVSPSVIDLLKVVFCRVMIETSQASFRHQSMSFKPRLMVAAPLLLMPMSALASFLDLWNREMQMIAESAASPIQTIPTVALGDARHLSQQLGEGEYSHVITSPPYPNRMSYVRELRPYMYWLGFLQESRDAGELDWQAIGGTWGCATSNLSKWSAAPPITIPYPGYDDIINRIAEKSVVLSRYIEKYFYDMYGHCQDIQKLVKHGGKVSYIIGNSKFYDEMLPTEAILAAILQDGGFSKLQITPLRKRSSKKELFEFLVTAYKA
jgi:hypothetical protein